MRIVLSILTTIVHLPSLLKRNRLSFVDVFPFDLRFVHAIFFASFFSVLASDSELGMGDFDYRFR